MDTTPERLTLNVNSGGLQDSGDSILRTKILDSFARSVWDRADFLPESCFASLITAGNITVELPNLPAELVDFICDNAKRAFATALLSGMVGVELFSAVETFWDHGFTDEALPISGRAINGLIENELEPNSDQTCSHDDPTDCFRHFPWTRSKIETFREMQWKFLAPVFKKDRRSYDIHGGCPLPFVWMSSGKRGLSSIVYGVRIHEDHQQISSTKDGNQPIFAVKELINDNRKSIWFLKAKALDEIRALSHPHLNNHIVSFAKDERYYFIYQWAGLGSLQDFWRENPSPVADGQWVLEWLVQLRGLTDTLVSMGKGTNGHFRPEKILRVEDSTRLGILQIVDAGAFKYHAVATSLRREATTRLPKMSRYESPGDFYELRLGQRAFDMWSMGCMVLEFAIWLLYGFKELCDFYDELNSNRVVSYWTRDKNTGTFKVDDSVMRWMDYVSKDPECSSSSALGDLLRLEHRGSIFADFLNSAYTCITGASMADNRYCNRYERPDPKGIR